MSVTASITPEKIGVLPDASTLPRMTFEEYLDWASDTTWAEWVDGKVIFLTARRRHQRIADFLQTVLQEWANRSETGGEALTAPHPMRCVPNGPAREPDVLFISRANPVWDGDVFMNGPADIAVEIISPDSVQRDRIVKFEEFERGGVGEYWIIDPESKTAEFYVRDNGSPHFRRAALEERTEDGNDGVYRSAAFPGLVIRVEWLWRDPLPSLFEVYSAPQMQN